MPYDDLPAPVRGWVDERLGSPVVEAVTQPGGFSPGAAARLLCADGTRAFVKAVSDEINNDSPRMHRREVVNAGALLPAAPAPRLLASYDDGTWVALLLQDVDGRHPELPWREDELRRVVAAIDELFTDLTPCPVPEASPVGDDWREEFTNWRDAVAAGPPAGIDPWCARHLDRLAGLESGWADAASGDTLLHLDLRADNMLVSADRVWIVDWPWAARGAPAFDLVGFAPSVAMQGGPDPEELLSRHAAARAADPEAIAAVIAAVAGYFTNQSLQPPAPGIPGVRQFQAAQGAVARRWLADRTGWL